MSTKPTWSLDFGADFKISNTCKHCKPREKRFCGECYQKVWKEVISGLAPKVVWSVALDAPEE